MQKHLWLLLFIVLSTAIESVAKAKEGDIKFGDYVIYEGSIEKKLPSGKGTLKLLNPADKKIVDAEISGEFNNMIVSNPDVRIGGWFDSSFLGDCEIEFIGESKNPTEIKFNLTKTQKDAKQLGLTLDIPSLVINFKKEDNSWAFGASQTQPDYITSEVRHTLSMLTGEGFTFFLRSDSSLKYPQILKSLGYSEIHDLWVGVISKSVDKGFGLIPLCLVRDGYRYYLFSEDKMINADNLLIYKIDQGGKWTGFVSLGKDKIIYRPIDSDSVHVWDVKLSSDEIRQMFILSGGDDKQMQSALDNRDLNYYVGTIFDVDDVIKSGFDASSIHYDNGQYHQGGKVINWINGESIDKLLSQLKENGASQDLLDQVANGEMPIDDAYAEVERTKNEKRQASAKFYKAHWTGTSVSFTGKLTGTAEGNKIFESMFGINSSFFKGTATLTLCADGTAAFNLLPEPTDKAFSEDRGRAIQITLMCEKMHKMYSFKGEWTIDGKKILINGENHDIELVNNNMISYHGMLGAKMIIKK